jgi:hypothetical protein
MALRALDPKRQVWTCCICGDKNNWTDEHRWYGSYKEFEEDGAIEVTCSEACRTVHSERLVAEAGADAANRTKAALSA